MEAGSIPFLLQTDTDLSGDYLDTAFISCCSDRILNYGVHSCKNANKSLKARNCYNLCHGILFVFNRFPRWSARNVGLGRLVGGAVASEMMSARLPEVAARPAWCWTRSSKRRAGAKGRRAVGIARAVKFGARILAGGIFILILHL